MEHTERERLISIISWGKIIVHHRSSSFVLRTPTPEEKARAALIYQQVLDESIRTTDILTNEEMLAAMIDFGQWTEQQNEQIEGIKQDIHNIRRGLLDLLFQRSRLEQSRQLLRKAETALTERLIERQELLKDSAESHAALAEQRYLISRITETEDGSQYWSSRESFDEEIDATLVQNLCKAFFGNRIPIRVIRSLARSTEWRTIWNAAKQTGRLFGKDIPEWSSTQLDLVHWSIAYDNVYEAYERPSEEIIEDDDLLDSWFIRQHEKIKGGSKSQNAPNNNKPSRGGKNEQFVMADAEGARHVYNMNDPLIRRKLRARQKALKQHGIVNEEDMPDSQSDMRQQLINSTRQRVKSISSR